VSVFVAFTERTHVFPVNVAQPLTSNSCRNLSLVFKAPALKSGFTSAQDLQNKQVWIEVRLVAIFMVLGRLQRQVEQIGRPWMGLVVYDRFIRPDEMRWQIRDRGLDKEAVVEPRGNPAAAYSVRSVAAPRCFLSCEIPLLSFLFARISNYLHPRAGLCFRGELKN
jgi:hypothetical protein